MPAYAYELNDENAPDRYLPPYGFPYGAAHTFELQYLFGLGGTPYPGSLSAPQQRLAGAMQRDWTSLARFGAPALGWPRFAAATQRVLSLALNEPATDFTPADRADPGSQEIDATTALPAPASVAAFMRAVVAPGVTPPARPDGPPPPWMANRPAALPALAQALRQYRLDPAAYAAFTRPVLFTFGSLTNPRWRAMRDRLQAYFPAFTSQEFEGLHHLNTSHQAEPDRTVKILMNFWHTP